MSITSITSQRTLGTLTTSFRESHVQKARGFAEQLILCTQGNGIYYYRNSYHSLSNLAKALLVFSQTNNIEGAIDATSAHGMGAWTQPTTVKETFQWALNNEIHGGVLQTIDAIKDKGDVKDLKMAEVADQAVAFLRELRGQGLPF